jgi:hypothetical protein
LPPPFDLLLKAAEQRVHKYAKNRRSYMAEIKWERDLNAALAKARQGGKPIFHDFWFSQ